jgi:hypothetical protein
VLVTHACADSSSRVHNVPSADDCELLIVDMPHGEWRIHVHPDGSGVYAYGALPALGRIEVESFDFTDVHARLASTVSNERQQSAAGYGTVQFCIARGDCGPLWYFYDRELAAELFDSAWANRSTPSSGIERETLETVNRIWSERRLD